MLIVGNWKAYVDSAEKAKALMTSTKKLSGKERIDIVVAPPAPYIGMFAGGKSSVLLAAQDVSDSTGGAATGEITASVLSDLGVSFVIIGHSERRAMGETDELIASKVQHALAHGITPILCIGERERDSDARYLHTLRTQIAAALTPLSQKERMQVIIAYEPIWAIGKSADESITAPDLHEMVLYIRKALADYVPGKAPASIKILYGGAVEPGNIRMLAGGTGVDGFLIGHASVDAKAFTALVKAVS